MRANERRGAWTLLIILLVIGLLLGVAGRCQRKISEEESKRLIQVSEISKMQKDSAAGDKSSKKKKEKKKGRGKYSKDSKKAIPFRDILSDTIHSEIH